MFCKTSLPVFLILIALNFIVACKPADSKPEEQGLIHKDTKIVSISSATTEILCELGFASNIVGLDVTSTYPDSIQNRPKVGYNRNISIEGILSLEPNYVIGVSNTLTAEQTTLLQQAGIKTLFFDHAFSEAGATTIIQSMADSLGQHQKGIQLTAQIKEDLKCLEALPDTPIVLFLYARGAGAISAAGKGTQGDEVIRLAGGRVPDLDFEGFKPLSTEILVEVNPDVILMFDSGLNSLSGPEGLMNVPGIAETNAGKNKAFVSMDGVLLTGYGPRLGKSVCELNQKLNTSRTSL